MRKGFIILLLLLIPMMVFAEENVTQSKPPQITEEQAQQVIQRAMKAKQEAFLKEYQALCKKYGFQLKANVQWVLEPIESK